MNWCLLRGVGCGRYDVRLLLRIMQIEQGLKWGKLHWD